MVWPVTPSRRATFEAWILKPTAPPPLLGQDTDPVLQELGYDAEAIQAVRSQGAI